MQVFLYLVAAVCHADRLSDLYTGLRAMRACCLLRCVQKLLLELSRLGASVSSVALAVHKSLCMIVLMLKGRLCISVGPNDSYFLELVSVVADDVTIGFTTYPNNPEP